MNNTMDDSLVFDTGNIPVGVVGLGLMGCSITACLLMAGHPVMAVAAIPADMERAERLIKEHLRQSYSEGLTAELPEKWLAALQITEDYDALENCKLVVECIIEDLALKNGVHAKIEQRVASDTLITSNTSAIPITIIQRNARHPERFLGLHWAEPSHITRFLEIICGEQTDIVHAEYLYALSRYWGKEATLVRKDIRGFITNRLMYAMYREAFNLVESGYASVEDVDRACRNNPGYWMTLVGVFRWMDITGLEAYHTVMKDLWPTLSNQQEVPEMMDKIVREGGRGVANGRGFYSYTEEEAKLWKQTFEEFSYDIRRLALKYPEDVVQQKAALINDEKADG